MTADPICVMRKICPEGQRHFIHIHFAAKVRQQPGILSRANAPALSGPFAVRIADAHTVNDAAGMTLAVIIWRSPLNAAGLQAR